MRDELEKNTKTKDKTLQEKREKGTRQNPPPVLVHARLSMAGHI